VFGIDNLDINGLSAGHALPSHRIGIAGRYPLTVDTKAIWFCQSRQSGVCAYHNLN